MKKVLVVAFLFVVSGTAWGGDCVTGTGGPCPPELPRHPSMAQGQGQAQGQLQGQAQGQNQNLIDNSRHTATATGGRATATGGSATSVSHGGQGGQGGRGGNANVVVNVSTTPQEPVTREAITLNQTVEADNSSSASTGGNGYDQAKDPALYRQHIAPPQATFSAPMWGTGRDAGNDMLDPENMSWLPDVTSFMVEGGNKVKSCELSAKRVYWSRDPSSTLQTTVIKHLPKTLDKGMYRVIGFVSGTCKKGDIFDLHHRIAEQGMKWAGDGLIYIQTGKGQKQEAFTFSFFGGGSSSSLNGDGKLAASATAGIGPTWANIDFKGYPGAIAAIVELISPQERGKK